jgi:hypothetical protein
MEVARRRLQFKNARIGGKQLVTRILEALERVVPYQIAVCHLAFCVNSPIGATGAVDAYRMAANAAKYLF